MRVQVDKTWRDDEAAGIDGLVCLVLADVADLGDPPILNSDVAAEARQTAAVDDHATADHAIEPGHVSSVSPSVGATRDSVNADG